MLQIEAGKVIFLEEWRQGDRNDRLIIHVGGHRLQTFLDTLSIEDIESAVKEFQVKCRLAKGAVLLYDCVKRDEREIYRNEKNEMTRR
jgi:hypothetical protein